MNRKRKYRYLGWLDVIFDIFLVVMIAIIVITVIMVGLALAALAGDVLGLWEVGLS